MGIFSSLFGGPKAYPKISPGDLETLLSTHRFKMAEIGRLSDLERRVVGTGVVLGLQYLADKFGEPSGDKLLNASFEVQSYAEAWTKKGNLPLSIGCSMVAGMLAIKFSGGIEAIRETSSDIEKLKDAVLNKSVTG